MYLDAPISAAVHPRRCRGQAHRHPPPPSTLRRGAVRTACGATPPLSHRSAWAPCQPLGSFSCTLFLPRPLLPVRAWQDRGAKERRTRQCRPRHSRSVCHSNRLRATLNNDMDSASSMRCTTFLNLLGYEPPALSRPARLLSSLLRRRRRLVLGVGRLDLAAAPAVRERKGDATRACVSASPPPAKEGSGD